MEHVLVRRIGQEGTPLLACPQRRGLERPVAQLRRPHQRPRPEAAGNPLHDALQRRQVRRVGRLEVRGDHRPAVVAADQAIQQVDPLLADLGFDAERLHARPERPSSAIGAT